MTKSYADFKAKYLGKAVDIDGAAGVQCVDTYKMYAEYLGYGIPGPLGGSGYAKEIYLRRANNGILNWCKEIPKDQKQPGDILVYKEYPGWTPASHVGIMDSNAGAGYHYCFSQNQGYSHAPGSVQKLPDDALYPLVFRPKCFIASGTAKNIPAGFTPEKATFTVTVQAINVRNKPSIKDGKVVAKYTKGQSVNYDCYKAEINGYVWISYISYSGERRYLACGETNNQARNIKPYGTFN